MAAALGLPEYLFVDPSSEGGDRASPVSTFSRSELSGRLINPESTTKTEYLKQLIHELNDSHAREQALSRLCNSKVVAIPDLAPLLWQAPGVMFKLLKEITGIYHLVSTPNLTKDIGTRVCNIITLFQCVATHPETKKPFMKANIPMYLYPFINTYNVEMAHEFLRLSTLGVIGALLKDKEGKIDPETIHFLLDSQVFCHCIRCMEVGEFLSRKVACFIVEKILMTEEGLNYCCNFGDRFYVVTTIMADMAVKRLDFKLLKYIIHCFRLLSDGPRDCDGLRCVVPPALRDPKVISKVADDPEAMRWLQEFYTNVANTNTAHQTHTSPATPEVLGRLVK